MDTQQKPSSGPKDFFMHLFAFGTLYVTAVSMISLWFQYINIKFPDPLNQYYSYGYDQLRWPMAALIVVFPVFLFLSRWMNRQIAADPARKELRVYKWLVYFTLFISAITAIVDLVTLIYNFLGGELTTRFGLKVLVVLIVAAGIFGYYLWQMRSDLAAATQKRRSLFWGAIVFVVISIVLAFFIAGSPSTARAQKFDQQRINDLQSIQWQVQAEYQASGKLPTFPSVTNQDPETMMAYEYHVTGSDTYQLCAVFNLSSPGRNYSQDIWFHPAGRTCFELNVKSIPKPVILR